MLRTWWGEPPSHHHWGISWSLLPLARPALTAQVSSWTHLEEILFGNSQNTLGSRLCKSLLYWHELLGWQNFETSTFWFLVIGYWNLGIQVMLFQVIFITILLWENRYIHSTRIKQLDSCFFVGPSLWLGMRGGGFSRQEIFHRGKRPLFIFMSNTFSKRLFSAVEGRIWMERAPPTDIRSSFYSSSVLRLFKILWIWWSFTYGQRLEMRSQKKKKKRFRFKNPSCFGF